MDMPAADSPGEAAPPAARPPYPGLRSFAREEADMFFGRDRCIGGMAETLQETRFLAVLGPSGSGKSSLVRSGLFMHLEAGFARKAGSRWTFLDMKHPRTSPYRELARETLDNERQAPGAPPPDPAAAWEPDPAALEARRRELLRDPLALVRWWRDRPGRHENENLLLLVDQFEELFAYATDRERNEVEGFIDLLLESAASEALPVYVVITMRSEFLGGCALFPGLAEQINRSLSLTPRMTRDECRQAIAGPAYGESLNLDPLLVTALLNDMNSLARFDDPGDPEAGADAEVSEISQADLIARRADQLPLMQHVLNWMWTLADRQRKNPGDSLDLTLDKYLELGGLRGAMSRHANEVKDSTGDPETVARIFRALTDQPTVATGGSAESSAVRRRRTIAQLAAEADVDPARVRSVVDAFRAEGVSMLTPDPESWPTLGDGDEVDISHESLIRQWSDLRGWIREEGESGRSWQELLRDVDKGKTLSGLDLDERSGWWKRARPHPAWADRYGGEYERVDEVMTRSRRRQWRRKMLFRALTGGALVAGVGTYAWAVNTQQSAADKVAAAMREADETARNSRRSSELAARYADTVRASAEKERDDARKIADAANREAERTRLEGQRLRQQSQAQLAASSVRLAQMEQMRSRIAGGFAAQGERQLQTIWSKPADEAPASLKEVLDNAELLRDTYPAAFSAIEPQLERAAGKVDTYSLETGEMLAAADRTEAAVRADGPGSAGDVRALRLGQAAMLRGRAWLLEGREGEALQSFDRAIDVLRDSSTPQARVALAEAQSERAGMLFDRGKESDALKAAKDCTASIGNSSYMETIARQADASLSPADRAMLEGSAVVEMRCWSLLALLNRDEEKAGEEWGKAVMPMMALIQNRSVDLSLARSEMLVRSATRMDLSAKELPDYLGMAFSLSVPGVWDMDDSAGNEIPAVRSRDFYPLDAVYRIRGLGEGTKWVFGSLRSSDKPAELLPFLNVSQSLLRVLPWDIQVPAGMIDPVSDAYRLHADNWIRLESLVDRDSYTALEKVLPQAADVIQNHERFLVATLDRLDRGVGSGGDPRRSPPDQEKKVTVAGPPPGADQLKQLRELIADRRHGLRGQARDLLRAGREQREWERFGTLLLEGSALIMPLCNDRTASFAADCSELDSTLAEIRGGYSQFAASQLRNGPGEGDAPRTFWADPNGFALAGYDPVTCFDKPGILERTASQARAPSAAAQSGEPNAPTSCTLRKGRLGYPYTWNGRVWLFESDENRRLFRESSETYAPRLGGYDFRAVLRSVKEKHNVTYLSAMRIGGRLYLTFDYVVPTEVKREDLAVAERNWAAIRSAPETEPVPGANSMQAPPDDATAMEPAIADTPLEEPPTAPAPDAPAPDDPPAPEAAKTEPQP